MMNQCHINLYQPMILLGHTQTIYNPYCENIVQYKFDQKIAHLAAGIALHYNKKYLVGINWL